MPTPLITKPPTDLSRQYPTLAAAAKRLSQNDGKRRLINGTRLDAIGSALPHALQPADTVSQA